MTRRKILLFFKGLIIAVLAEMLLAFFVIESDQLSTDGMVPTLIKGDFVFVSKLDFGVGIPLTNYRYFYNRPEYTDVVVFEFVPDPDIEYLKRIVAIGGDTLDVMKDQIVVNGLVANEPYAFYDPSVYVNDSSVERFIVPEDHVFVLGDNRNNSYDSRHFGPVPLSNILGKARMIYWNHDPDKTVFRGYQPARIGQWIN